MNRFIFETPIRVIAGIGLGILIFVVLIFVAIFSAPEGYEDDSGYHDGTEKTKDE